METLYPNNNDGQNLFSFSPREGIWLMETSSYKTTDAHVECFSPREGIWLMETLFNAGVIENPGRCFSPREGIWLMETLLIQGELREYSEGFSPREGIWLMETEQTLRSSFV